MVSADSRLSQSVEGGRPGAPIILAHEQSFRLRNVEFRPATREVSFAEQTIVIEPRVMQVMIALYRASGAVVSKIDLLQTCWAGQIVGDDAINRVISKLRAVAEKEAGDQFRIETITRVGYRLLAAHGEALDAPIGATAKGVRREASVPLGRRTTILAATFLLALVTAGTWFWSRLNPSTEHSMMVRLSGFRTQSADLPATMPEAFNAEIVAAFSVDGMIGVSTNAKRPAEATPAYALGGTIYRVGNNVRVITQFSNERSGAVLWSDSVDYEAEQLPNIAHKVAADAGTVVRCGLSGAATYHKPLPDPVMSNYMQYCQQYWAYGGTKTLRFAQLVVAAVPDFSWGWSAVGNGFMQAANAERDGRRAEAMRTAGRQAEDKALALDPQNSEALGHKAHMLDPRDWIARERLFKSAVAARPLDCGCEYMGYGWHLEQVGRLGAAIVQYRAATDTLALWPNSQIALADVLVATGRNDQAKSHYVAAVDLSKDVHLSKQIAATKGVETGDIAAAMAALRSPQLQIAEESRTALLSGYAALASGKPQAKAKAVRALATLPSDSWNDTKAIMLAALGANREALQAAADSPNLFWLRSTRGVLDEPGFPDVAQRLRLFAYWRASRTKPDVCMTKDAPRFCTMI